MLLFLQDSSSIETPQHEKEKDEWCESQLELFQDILSHERKNRKVMVINYSLTAAIVYVVIHVSMSACHCVCNKRAHNQRGMGRSM